jgi:hypothetical protein
MEALNLHAKAETGGKIGMETGKVSDGSLNLP